MQRIDPDFDFYSETPAGGDPDACSPTLKLYHKLLWSKPLPSGDRFDLDDAAFGRFPYLRHESALGTFELSSDGMIATFHYYKRQSVRQLMDQLPHGIAKQFHDDVCNIGGYILFPKNKVPGVHSINQARGCHPQLSDRFDLALECIRRHYLGEGSPLADVLSRHSDFFDLFGDFKGYVEFFLLQDFTNADCTAVRFWTDDFDNFTAPPIPQTVKAYLEYARRAGAACRAVHGAWFRHTSTAFPTSR